MEWKDTTSYSKGDKDRIPSSWSANIGKLRIVVVSNHIHYPGRWVLHCSPFFNTHELKVDTKEQAQAEAARLVKIEIAAIIADLEKESAQ